MKTEKDNYLQRIESWLNDQVLSLEEMDLQIEFFNSMINNYKAHVSILQEQKRLDLENCLKAIDDYKKERPDIDKNILKKFGCLK
jgi:hypothetical protein